MSSVRLRAPIRRADASEDSPKRPLIGLFAARLPTCIRLEGPKRENQGEPNVAEAKRPLDSVLHVYLYLTYRLSIGRHASFVFSYT
jgi:hypothetical protein